MNAAPDDGDFRIWFARLEAKLDVALAHQGAKLDDVERRIERMEQAPCPHDEEVKELKQQVRVLEGRPSISWRQILSSLGGTAALIVASLTILDRLYL